jgi:hypothetical protein
MANRLTFTIRRPVSELAEELLLLVGAGAYARLRLVLDGSAFDLVDDVVERRLVADPRRGAPQGAPVDDQRDLGDVGVRGTAVHLVGELDDGVGPIVQHTFEAAELPCRVLADPLGDLDVLALDDRPHGCLRAVASDFEYTAGGEVAVQVSAPWRR